MLVKLISQAVRSNVCAIIVRQRDLGSLIITARRVNGELVVEKTESDEQFVTWLNEAEDAAKAIPLVGWSQRYDAKAQALVLKPILVSGRAREEHRIAAA